ncbi:hypothetical protein KEM60_01340 [Austwickia sp. TVS 96-490-7B]|uniref:hypothetical protein n=1 Tax=Austwickia sp. TVS 96-490-7B TaxID=2830843 RepID=UPI001C5A35A6|nr:hypothetical protein [Austwickia sp. TVS 96-490-7B]MBW3085143.1 hypothetical protein [Austwickia sp. TVS 96-490-7B]
MLEVRNTADSPTFHIGHPLPYIHQVITKSNVSVRQTDVIDTMPDLSALGGTKHDSDVALKNLTSIPGNLSFTARYVPTGTDCESGLITTTASAHQPAPGVLATTEVWAGAGPVPLTQISVVPMACRGTDRDGDACDLMWSVDCRD